MDEEDLAAKMEAMFNTNSESLVKMGIAGRKIAEDKFNEKIVIDKYLDAVQSV